MGEGGATTIGNWVFNKKKKHSRSSLVMRKLRICHCYWSGLGCCWVQKREIKEKKMKEKENNTHKHHKNQKTSQNYHSKHYMENLGV